MNPSAFSSLSSDLNISEGFAKELSIQIDWMELVKYWTEIKSKYHIDSEDEDEDLMELRTDNMSSGSEIVIKNLTLNIETTKTTTSSSSAELISNNNTQNNTTFQPDLYSDFLDHIFSKFKVKIEGINVRLNEEIIIKCKETILIHAEFSGIRKIQIPEFKIQLLDEHNTHVLVRKGLEIIIKRTIEGINVKFQISEIEFRTDNINEVVLKLANMIKLQGFDSEMESKTRSNVSIEIMCDCLIFKLNSLLQVIINDVYINESGQFITGHIQAKWMGSLILNSSIQTQVIKGNFNELKFEIDDELEIFIKNIKLIDDLKTMIVNNTKENYGKSSYNFNPNISLQINSLNIKIEDYAAKFTNLSLKYGQIVLDTIDIIHDNSQIVLQGISYFIKPSSPNENKLSPFSDLKRFIENDEIISIENRETLLKYFLDFNSFDIKSFKGKVIIDDIIPILKGKHTGNSTNGGLTSLTGIIHELNLELGLDDDYYELQLDNLEVLSGSFLDLRIDLKIFKRNDKILLESGKINCTRYAELFVIDTDGINLHLPYNLPNQLKLDIIRLGFNEPVSNENNTNIYQVVMKNMKFDLEGPDQNNSLTIQSEFTAKEVVIKMEGSNPITVFLDELKVKLDEYMIFNSGLLKFTLSDYLDLRNHCSHISLTPESFDKLKRYVQFWSETYSPIIQEIVPDPIYYEIDPVNANKSTESTTPIGTVIKDESLELELDIFFDEEDLNEFSELNLNTNENEEIDEKDENHTKNNDYLKDLLNDVDEEFFKEKTFKKLKSFFKIINFGLEIKLILPEIIFKITLSEINGEISTKSTEIKVTEGLIEKETFSNSVVLGRWRKGPDVTCKYPIEDANFVKIQAEKIENVLKQSGIDEYNLIISISPLRLFLDQKSLNYLSEFFKIEPKQSSNNNNNVLRGFIFFNKVNIGALALKLDYNPNLTATTGIPLQGAEMILPKIELRGIKGFEGLGPAILSSWIPELKGKKLAGVLKTGLVPVRTIVNLGGGMVELILLPWQLGTNGSAAQTVAHIRRNSKQIGLETLKLTTTIANRASKLLNNNEEQKILAECSYPMDFQSGVQQAAQLIIALPTRIHHQNYQKGPLRAVPLFILDSAATATGALTKTLQGIQAEFDREIFLERKLKLHKNE